MVKRLAELHGGTVAVASAEGEGSIFAVWLPIRAGEASSVETLQSRLEYRIDLNGCPRECRPGGRGRRTERPTSFASCSKQKVLRVLRASSAEEALAMATLATAQPDHHRPRSCPASMDGSSSFASASSIALAHVPVVIIAALIDGEHGSGQRSGGCTAEADQSDATQRLAGAPWPAARRDS